jgi:hypothetical protein
VISPPTSGGGVAAYAECLAAPFPLSVQATTATGTTSSARPAYAIQAACPAGTLLTGGGFASDQALSGGSSGLGVAGSYPGDVAAWSVNGTLNLPRFPTSVTVSAYAMCLTAAQLTNKLAVFQPLIIAPATAPTGCGNNPCLADNQVNSMTACPAGELTVGGGFSALAPDYTQTGISFGGEAISLVTDGAAPNGASWVMQVHTAQLVLAGKPGAAAKMITWAVCLAST